MKRLTAFTAILFLVGLLCAVFLPVHSQTIVNAVTRAMLQSGTWTLSGVYKLTGATFLPSGIALPATCDASVSGARRFFHLSSDNTFYMCTATNTWTSVGGIPNPLTTNQEFSGTITLSGTALSPGNQFSLDWFWPGNAPHYLGAFRTATWIDVPAPSVRLRIRSMRILAGGRSFSFSICGSKTQPETCRYAVLCGPTAGWSLWYADSEANYDYEDLDGDATPQIHFQVASCDGSWSSFRTQIEGDIH